MKKDAMDDFYKILHPKLAVLVATVDEKGKPNVMTCAWCTPVSEEPPTVAIAVWKGAYTNQVIKKTKEFTVNVPTADLLDKVWLAGTKSGKKVDKVSLLKLTMEPGKKVKAPVVGECAAHLECKLVKSLDVGECTLFVGEVLAAYADEELFKKGTWNLKKAKLPLHLGGKSFAIAEKTVKP